MIFNTLYESSQRGELMLIDGGFCHFHLRKDGQLTIREIISTRPGAGQEMLKRLCATPGATSLFAKCPAELPANAWYERRGFICEGEERTRSGRVLKLWRLALPLPAAAANTSAYDAPQRAQAVWRDTREGGELAFIAAIADYERVRNG